MQEMLEASRREDALVEVTLKTTSIKVEAHVVITFNKEITF